MKVKDPYTHTRCGCEWCRIAKAQKTPHLRNRGGWSPELFPGDLIIGDLCTGWFPSQDGETVALVLKDAASGLKYVKALKSKVPEGVRSGLSEFRLMLIDFRAWSGMPPPERPFVFHTDRGGEFGGKALLDWVAQQGGVMKLAPKGAHVSIAEQTVRDVLQGTRVGCFRRAACVVVALCCSSACPQCEYECGGVRGVQEVTRQASHSGGLWKAHLLQA
jgi:hypothetical protein